MRGHQPQGGEASDAGRLAGGERAPRLRSRSAAEPPLSSGMAKKTVPRCRPMPSRPKQLGWLSLPVMRASSRQRLDAGRVALGEFGREDLQRGGPALDGVVDFVDGSLGTAAQPPDDAVRPHEAADGKIRSGMRLRSGAGRARPPVGPLSDCGISEAINLDTLRCLRIAT